MIRSATRIQRTVVSRRRWWSSCRLYGGPGCASLLSPSSGTTLLREQCPAQRHFSAAGTTAASSTNNNNNNNNNSEEEEKTDERGGYFGTANKSLGDRGKVETDFFGESVTFLGLHKEQNSDVVVPRAMAALDGFLLGVVSKGRTCIGGGQEGGLAMQAAHSVALQWAEALRHAAVWNDAPDDDDNDIPKAAPMLAVVAVAPVLVQTGLAYLRHMDALLAQAKPGPPGVPTIQMESMARAAVAHKDNDAQLTLRERLHLQALHHLLLSTFSGHATAMTLYQKILELCPGDVFALSQVMDLCWVLGDKASAMR